jgi:UTP:GlnB (protein PII) uridylyltransferase
MIPKSVSSSFLDEFTASMPPAYRGAFPPDEIGRHARTAFERRTARASVNRVQSAWHPGTVALCIVAGDRPGLLATISAALVLNGLDIVHAEAYTRRTPAGTREAVDLFWVREIGTARLGPAGVAEIETTLGLLLDGRVSLREIVRRHGRAPSSAMPETRVRFLAGRDGGLAVLEVETADRAGLLLALADALHTQRVDIVRAEVRTEQGKVLDRFMVTEIDGTPISASRRLKLQVAVLGVIQPAPFPANREQTARPGERHLARASG